MFPYKNRDKYIIFIKDTQIYEQNSFIGTYFHELTHIFDYTKFMADYNINNFYDLLNYDFYNIFFLWTEFHARYNGYKVLRSSQEYYNGKKYDKTEVFQHINNIEIPFQNQFLSEDIKSYNDNKIHLIEFMYNMVQYLGKFSVWEEYNSELFNKKTLIEDNELFNCFNGTIANLYETLKEIKQYNEAKNKLNILSSLFNDVYYKYKSE